MMIKVGMLVSMIEVRDGLGRPRYWKTAEVVGVEDGLVVVSYYKSFKDEERTIKRMRVRDLENFTKKDLEVSVKNYYAYMKEFGDHKCEEWKLLKELGYVN